MFRKLIASPQYRRRVSWAIAVILLLPFAVFGAYQAGPSRGEDRAGVIFGRSVSWDEFELQRRQVLNQWREELGEAAEAMAPMVIQLTWDRLMLLEEAKRRRIRVDDREVADLIRRVPSFQEQGRFVPDRYHQFLAASGLNPQTFERLLRNDMLIERLVNGVKSKVTVTDEDVRDTYRRDHEQLRATLWMFDAEAFEAEAEAALTDEALRAHYDQHPDAFRVPERVTFEYAGAAREDLRAKLEMDEASLQAYYDTHAEEFLGDDGGVKPLADVREQVRDAVAREQLRKRLTALTIDLEDDLKAKRPFDEVVTARGLTRRAAGPVSLDDLWITDGPEPAVLHRAAELAAGEVSEVIETDNGVSVVRMLERVPARVPPFDEIREQVRTHTVGEESRRLAKERAEALYEHLERQQEAGVRVEEAVLMFAGPAPASQVQFTREGPVGQLGTDPRINLEAFDAPLGEFTNVIETARGFAILRPEERLEADVSGFADAQGTLRTDTLNERQQERLSEWLAGIRSQAKLRNFVESPAPGAWGR